MLVLLVDELNTGASLCAELAVRSAFMTRGAPHKVISAGRRQKKAGLGADDAWRAASRSAGLSLDKAKSAPLTKKDLKRADLLVALSAQTADALNEQGFRPARWLPQEEVWAPTQASVEAFVGRASAWLDEIGQ